MAKKSVLEKELRKRISPGLVLLFILFLTIGFAVGYFYKYITPKEDYSIELIGDEVVIIETKDDYIEKLVKVYKNGEVVSNVDINIIGTISDKVGTYYLKYQIKGIEKLENVTLQRVVIVKGVTSGEPSEDSVEVQ